MDDNEVNPWSTPTAPVTPEPVVEPLEEENYGRLRQVWRGAKTGFRLTSYVMGPIAGLLALMAAIPTAVGMGAGRGFDFHKSIFNAAGLYLGSVALGMIVGGMIGLVRRIVPAREGSLPVLDRPIRLRFRKKRPAALLQSWQRRRRWPWVLVGLTWLVLVSAFGVGVYLGKWVDYRLDAAVAEADRDDPNWRVDDLLAHREPVPDEENSAPVVDEVVSLLPKSWPSSPARNPGQPPTKNEVGKALDRATAPPENHHLDSETVEVLRRELDQYAEAVRLARTVADYDRGRHELVLGPTLLDTLLPETQQARTAARLLLVDAALRAYDGELDAALDSCRAVIGVGRSIGDEPFLISQLVRSAIGLAGLNSARHVLGQGEPSDEALARLQTLALDEMHAPLLLYGMRGERATDTELIRRIAAGELPLSALSGYNPQTAAKKSAIAPWGSLWLENQLAVGLEWTNDAVAISRRPSVEWGPGWKAWSDEIDRVRHSRRGVYAAMIPLLMMPAVSASSTAHLRYQAELGATALVLAAERHRRKTGHWPESAESIAPDILANPPLDPYSGRPFIFEHRDGRLIIHTVGPNLKDEQGAYDLKRFGKQGGLDDVGASVWDIDLRRQPSP